jgi:hypothetical protein
VARINRRTGILLALMLSFGCVSVLDETMRQAGIERPEGDLAAAKALPPVGGPPELGEATANAAEASWARRGAAIGAIKPARASQVTAASTPTPKRGKHFK